MKTHAASIQIDATPQQVWEVLVDFPEYPSWNHTITEASGALRVGERLNLQLCLDNGSRPFAPRVMRVEPGHELLLSAQLLHPGLLLATHSFRIEQEGEHGARLTQRWELAGMLAGLVWPKFRQGFPAFERMNQELAREVGRRWAHA